MRWLPPLLLVVFALPVDAAAAPSSLRGIDWANRNYGPAMRLHNGRYFMRRYPARSHPMSKRCRHTSQTARLIKVHYGDLNGDGRAEAVVELSTYRDMCTALPVKRRVFIAFVWAGGRAREVGRVDYPQVDDMTIQRAAIRIRRREVRSNHHHDCVDVWRVTAGKLAQDRRHSKCVAAP